jgi:hypothetical protein
MFGRLFDKDALANILVGSPVGTCFVTPQKAINAIIGVPTANGDPANWKGRLVDLSDRETIRRLVDTINSELVFDGMRSQIVGLSGSLKQTKSKKKAGSPTHVGTGAIFKRTSHDTAQKLVDVDAMLDLVYDVYLSQAGEEMGRITKIAKAYDIDGDNEISLNEFKAIVNHCAPDLFSNRQLLHYFSRLSDTVAKYQQIEHTDKGAGVRRQSLELEEQAKERRESCDNNDADPSVTIEYVATWCLTMGIITPEGNK